MKLELSFWSGICVRHERDARASWGSETTLGDLGPAPLGKIFDDEMELLISEGWISGNYQGLSQEIINRLDDLKNQGYELVIKPSVNISGSNPEPDLLFVKKIGQQYNFNDCIYVDNKYFHDVGFTSAQAKITSAFNENNEAEVILNVQRYFLNGDLIPVGTAMKIKKVEIFTVNTELELVKINKKP